MLNIKKEELEVFKDELDIVLTDYETGNGSHFDLYNFMVDLYEELEKILNN